MYIVPPPRKLPFVIPKLSSRRRPDDAMSLRGRRPKQSQILFAVAALRFGNFSKLLRRSCVILMFLIAAYGNNSKLKLSFLRKQESASPHTTDSSAVYIAPSFRRGCRRELYLLHLIKEMVLFWRYITVHIYLIYMISGPYLYENMMV
jgi:hypothetical protein